MAKNKLKHDGILFAGHSSQDVTGSCYLIQFAGYKILLECGLYQSSKNSYLDAYKINSEKFKFKPSEIDFVFLLHTHIDHIGLVPRLVKEGFTGKIITTKNTSLVMKPLLINSCYIIKEEARLLSKRYKRNYEPVYSEEDVYKALSMVEVYDKYQHIYKLNDTISFQWFENSHCLGAAQLQLILKSKNKTKKILYTSDIGGFDTDNDFVNNTVIPSQYNDITIMESTYGESKRKSNKSRKFDVDNLKSVIDTTIERGGSVVMPCFSFSRTQQILSTIYDIYHDDKSFNTQIIVDSKLSCEISKLYFYLLHGDNLRKWENIYNWKNVKFISNKDDSQNNVASSNGKIIISASGFCTNGRIVNYLKKHIKNKNSTIVFSGYVGDNPSYLSYRIKNYRDNKVISINKTKVQNNSDCVTLSTFSSHANYNDLIKYGSSLNTGKLVLVHGSAESKKSLAIGLKEAISNNDKTYKVVSSFQGMIINL